MYIYFLTLCTLLMFDGIWLLYVAKAFYEKQLGTLLAEKVTYWPVGLFYTLYAFGIVYFAITPALEAKSLMVALYRGAFLGLLAYGAYDFTNQATLAKWPVAITIVDLLWGVTLTAAASGIVYLIAR